MKGLVGFLVDLRFKNKGNALEACDKIGRMNDFKGEKKNKRLIQEIVKVNSAKSRMPLEDMKLVVAEMAYEVLFSEV